jgi:hypothetical protein
VVDELDRHHCPQSAVVGEVVLAHRFRLPSGLRRFAHRATSVRFQTRVARRRTIGSGKSGSPVKRIAFRRVVPRSSATSARPRRFLPSAVIPSKMVSQRLDRLCCVRRQQSFSSRPLCARSERQVEECSFPCKAALFRRWPALSLSRESSFRSMEGSPDRRARSAAAPSTALVPDASSYMSRSSTALDT